MQTLFFCRISNAGLRKKIFARLRDYGFSHGAGLFECDLSDSELARIFRFLDAQNYGSGDTIISWPLCRSCFEKRKVFGSPVEPPDDSSWLII